MNYSWKKLFLRKDCDLTTFEGVICTAYDILWQYTGKKQEYLFAHLDRQNIHYYLKGVDEFTAARYLYKKRFFTPQHVKRSYREGLLFLRQTSLKTEKWKKTLNDELSRGNLLKAVNDFSKDFRELNYQYSILPWWALESWQYDFLKIVNGLIKKNTNPI